MARPVRWLVVLGAFLVFCMAPWVLPVALAGSAPRVLDREEVRVTAHIPPLAAVQMTRGSILSFAYDGAASTVRIADALAFDVMANAPWEVQVQVAGPFAVNLSPVGTAGSRGPARTSPSGSVSGGAGRHTYRWDVSIRVPEGTPAGLYQMPVSVLVGLNVP